MRFLRVNYFFLHLILFVALVAIDQLSKYSASQFLTSSSDKSLLGFSLQAPVKNYNLIFGLNFISDSLFINTFLTAVFCLFLFYYILSLSFIPKVFYHLQIGITVLFSGFTSNLMNKLLSGYVTDFIKWTPSQTLSFYFNLSDVFQTIAWVLIFSQFFFLKKHMWRKEEKRKQLIIMKAQQLQFAGYSALAFLSISSFFLLLTYQFLGLIELTDFANIRQISSSFFMYSFFILLLLCLSIGIFFLYLSNKIYGPLYAFERYIKALINGEKPEDLRLRKNDQLKHLEKLARDIKDSIKKTADTD